MTVTDAALMTRIAAGDQQAFALLMQRHAGMVLNVLYRIVLSRDEAEDLCQEAFTRLWQQAPHWRDEAQPATWLYRVASNLALNHKQRVQARHLTDTDEAERQADVRSSEPVERSLEAPDQRQRQQQIAEALRLLPDNQRQAMVFRYYQGLAVKDIATIMSLGNKAVESLLSRAKSQLKAILGDLYDEL